MFVSASVALADSHGGDDMEKNDYQHSEEAQEYVHGNPSVEQEPWLLTSGGRIYDNWWIALDGEEPEGTIPSYPTDVNSAQGGSGTWRCKECHGWDYRGKDGLYGSGSHYSGIVGINGAIGHPVEQIARTLRDENRPYIEEMISEDEMLRVAAFVSVVKSTCVGFLI